MDDTPEESRLGRAVPRAAAPPRIVIVGAGFAGIEVAKALQGTPARVTVIDRRNYSLFQPLLYQVATAALSPAEVAVPLRGLVHGRNVEMLLDRVVGVDVERSLVRTAGDRAVAYDDLVLATGSEYNYFGHDGWWRLAPSPKGLTEAVEIRRRLLLAFERAEMCENEAERRAFMTFVVVGAGSTGVEMAGAIAELAKAVLSRDFRRIDPGAVAILLIEAGPRMLAGFSASLGAYAERAVKRMGVQVLLNTAVEAIDAEGVVAQGRRIEARTVIWAAGVKATPVGEWLGVKPGRHGTVAVRPDFSIEGHPNIYVIGDAADARDSQRRPLPGLAAVAKQEGQYLGALLRSRLMGKPEPPAFRYRDYGTMATIGRNSAVADLRGLRLKGRFAWLLWGAVHIYFLIGFRNRMLVLVNWLWAWITYAHGARLILDAPERFAARDGRDSAH